MSYAKPTIETSPSDAQADAPALAEELARRIEACPDSVEASVGEGTRSASSPVA